MRSPPGGSPHRRPAGPTQCFRFAGALGGRVTMELGPVATGQADHVLAVASCGRLWLFTRHRRRGLELPGGKLRAGERPLAGLARELYEETGAIVWRRPRAVARYRVEHGQDRFEKLVFAVEVGVMLEPPQTGDGAGRELLVPPPPQVVARSPIFSPLLKDRVYPLLYARLHGPQPAPPHPGERCGWDGDRA